MTLLHDIWNPWHGCKKCSEGCQNCYMYYLDSLRDKDGSQIYRTKSGFKYPLSKNRDGSYKVKSGEMLRVCMTSDFFLEEADPWRDEAWAIIKQRPDVKFYLLTKRPERVADHLPWDWGDGWENVILQDHHDLAVCYAMKEEMCQLYELTDYRQAYDGRMKWFEAAKESGIPALVKFATQKECRIPGLAAHALFSISTGKLEGFNNKIKVAKRIGYSYRDDAFFFTLIRYLSIPAVRSSSHKNP